MYSSTIKWFSCDTIAICLENIDVLVETALIIYLGLVVGKNAAQYFAIFGRDDTSRFMTNGSYQLP